MKHNNKEIAVIGLGTFGYEVATKLYESGHSVLAVDKNAEIINKIKDKVTIAVQADVTDEDILKKLDFEKFNKVILGMSDSLETLILAVTHLKKLNINSIVVKANTHIQKEILLKIGADEVIQPEVTMAHMLVRKISYPYVLESLTVDSKNSLIEISVPEKFSGKTLRELDLRNKYGIIVILKSEKDRYHIVTNPDTILFQAEKIFVAGEETKILEVFNE
ncbi:MAG: TrkA family potassium uptake protein [Bacteroidetes bacterium]|nr:MAG: TrkA family potassium uptake protein [Bacteroidota bacterium]